MKSAIICALLFCCATTIATKLIAEDLKSEKPIQKITPGKVIIPFEKMRRIWGELVSVDLATRTGTFRAEGDDTVMQFTVLPYAEMLHHATFGDLKDFQIGERAIFRMHEDEAGEWTWLTYIQDEMNMLNGHKEYYFVDAIDSDQRQIEFTQAKFDKSFVREQGLILKTDEKTKYWKGGKPARFTDIRVGDKLRAKTHGVGKGRVRVAWHIFLDDESLIKFQDEQKQIHVNNMKNEGLPGYLDRAEMGELDLTIFQEGSSFARMLKKGQSVWLAEAGEDRKAKSDVVSATVVSYEAKGKLTLVRLTTKKDTAKFQPSGVIRLFLEESTKGKRKE